MDNCTSPCYLFFLFTVYDDMLPFVSMPKSAAGSAPSLPSYSSQISPAVHYTRPRVSPPPVICHQLAARDVQRCPSPISRRPSLTGRVTSKQKTPPVIGKLGRAPSTPVFCALQPSSASPAIKVILSHIVSRGHCIPL